MSKIIFLKGTPVDVSLVTSCGTSAYDQPTYTPGVMYSKGCVPTTRFWKLDYVMEGVNGCISNLSEMEAATLLSKLQTAMKGQTMFKDLAVDAKAFIHDHRNLIFWIALLFAADHFFFNGKFRERLNAMVEKLIGSAEKKIEALQ